MPKSKKSKLKPRLVIKQGQTPSPEDLEEFVREASEVKLLTQTAGWTILERDLLAFRNGLMNNLAYVDPTRPEHKEARILFIAIDKIFNLVNDYQENRDIAMGLLEKINNPELAVTLDMDNA